MNNWDEKKSRGDIERDSNESWGREEYEFLGRCVDRGYKIEREVFEVVFNFFVEKLVYFRVGILGWF